MRQEGRLRVSMSFEQFLDSNLVKVILVPAIAGASAFGFYLLKRNFERTKDFEKMAQLHQAIDLKEKLDRSHVTLQQVRSFRAEALRESLQVAFTSANYYVGITEKLTQNIEEAENEGVWPEAITQFDMNKRSAEEAALADGMLAGLVIDLMAGSEAEAASALQHSQTAWLAWRDAELLREGRAWEGGTIRPLMVNLRHEALTRERIASLQTELCTPDGCEIQIKREKTPRNLLDRVCPHVPHEHVRQWLGTPHYISGSIWYYRYEETQVQITFNDQQAVSEVVVALCHGHTYNGIVAAWGDFTLGQLSIGAILQLDEQIEVEYHSSLRTEELTIHIRTGSAGAWSECFFGALRTNSGAGHLMDVYFEWAPEANKLASNPFATLINWVGVSGTSLEPPSFDWFIRQ